MLHNNALQPTANPLRGLSAAEFGRYAVTGDDHGQDSIAARIMCNTFARIRRLISEGSVRISEHGYDEIIADGLLARELVEGVEAAEVVEDYPNYPKGPCVLLLQRTKDGRSVHTVWGLPAGHTSPAVLITAYLVSARKSTTN